MYKKKAGAVHWISMIGGVTFGAPQGCRPAITTVYLFNPGA